MEAVEQVTQEHQKDFTHNDPDFRQKIIPQAFYKVDEYGQRNYLSAKGYETKTKGASVNLNEFTPSAPYGRGFTKEIYVQEREAWGRPGTIYHLRYSPSQNAWVIEDGRYERIIDAISPLTVGQSSQFNFHFQDSNDSHFINSIISIDRIVVLDTKEILPAEEGQPTSDHASDIIQQYHEQLEKYRETPSLEYLQTQITVEDDQDSEDISHFSEDWGTEENLPKSMKADADLMRGIKHLYAHSMHDREYLLQDFKEKHEWSARWNRWTERKLGQLKRRFFLQETGHALVKDKSTGSAVLSKTRIQVGEEHGIGGSIDLFEAQQRANDAGEEVIGTFHVHPLWSEEYQKALKEKYGPGPDPDIELTLQGREKEIVDQIYTLWDELAPPSVPDIANALQEQGTHLIASQEKVYSLVGKLRGKEIRWDEAYGIYHSKIQNYWVNYARAASKKDTLQIPREELERVIFTPIQEFCQEIGVAMYMGNWDPKVREQPATILQRIA